MIAAAQKTNSRVHLAYDRSSETQIAEQDLLSIRAVIEHIAYGQNLEPKIIQSLVEAEFSVTQLEQIPTSAVHDVMEFLITLRMDSIRSGK